MPKSLIFATSDYDDFYIDQAFVVPDEFDYASDFAAFVKHWAAAGELRLNRDGSLSAKHDRKAARLYSLQLKKRFPAGHVLIADGRLEL